MLELDRALGTVKFNVLILQMNKLGLGQRKGASRSERTLKGLGANWQTPVRLQKSE